MSEKNTHEPTDPELLTHQLVVGKLYDTLYQRTASIRLDGNAPFHRFDDNGMHVDLVATLRHDETFMFLALDTSQGWARLKILTSGGEVGWWDAWNTTRFKRIA